MTEVDPTEDERRAMVAEINNAAAYRKRLEAQYGPVWNTQELGECFEVNGFMAPFVIVQRKSDQQRGTLTFQHYPRFYFDFMPHD